MYRNSTQRKFWLFSKQQLEEIQRKTCLDGDNKDIKGAETRISFEEEQILKVYYERKLVDIGKDLKFPKENIASGIIFFKRFFCLHSIKKNDYKLIMLTCLYLGSKVEEYHVDIEELAFRLKIDPRPLLRLELPVLEGVKFHLKLFHPFSPLRGFMKEIYKYENDDNQNENDDNPNDNDDHEKKNLFEEAMNLVLPSLCTDLPLLTSPSMLAMIILRYSTQKQKDNNNLTLQFDDFFRSSSNEKYKDLLEQCIEWGKLFEELLNKKASDEAVACIARKWKIYYYSAD